MTEIYLHSLFAHYGLYGNAPVDDDREFVSSVCALLVLCHCRTAGVPREASGMNEYLYWSAAYCTAICVIEFDTDLLSTRYDDTFPSSPDGF